MNQKYLRAAVVICLMSFFVTPWGVFAQDTNKADKALDAVPAQPLTSERDTAMRDTANKDYSEGYLAQRLGAMQKSTQIVGTRVLDHYDMPLGKVTDILVALQAGKIYCALVSVGDPEYTVAVPGRNFLPAADTKVILDMEKDKLKGGPRVTAADWDYAMLRRTIGDSYAYFGQKPMWDEKAGMEHVNKSSDFIGMEVKDKDNQGVGRVENLMVDLPTARVVYVIVAFDNSGKSHYAVPPQAMVWKPETMALVLNESKATIQARAQQGDYFWTEMTDKGWAANTYRSYGIEPDFEAGVKADPTREQVRAKMEDGPPSKVAGKSDSEVTRMVLTAMVQEDMNSAFNHKNIKINTVNGRVTLTGHVKSDKQKAKLGELTENVVGQGYVDNQLEVK